MEIHAPESPVNSFKDFAIHIAIVRCGISIALGLEGIREAVDTHSLVRETRENIRREMEINDMHEAVELPRVTLYRDKLKALVRDLPAIGVQHPEQVNQRLDQSKIRDTSSSQAVGRPPCPPVRSNTCRPRR